jgi:hypothetical protein
VITVYAIFFCMALADRPEMDCRRFDAGNYLSAAECEMMRERYVVVERPHQGLFCMKREASSWLPVKSER